MMYQVTMYSKVDRPSWNIHAHEMAIVIVCDSIEKAMNAIVKVYTSHFEACKNAQKREIMGSEMTSPDLMDALITLGKGKHCDIVHSYISKLTIEYESLCTVHATYDFCNAEEEEIREVHMKMEELKLNEIQLEEIES